VEDEEEKGEGKVNHFGQLELRKRRRRGGSGGSVSSANWCLDDAE